MDLKWETNWGRLSVSTCQIINDICFKLSVQYIIAYMKDALNNVAFIHDVRTHTSNKLLFLWKKMTLFAANPPVLARWDDFSSLEEVKDYVENC